MKFVFFLTSILCALGCSSDSIKTKERTDSFLNSEVEKFDKLLEESIIEPTAVINLDTTETSFLGFKIETRILNDKLVILLNDEKIDFAKLETLNEVWGKRDSLNFGNAISQIKYYKYHNLMSFQLKYTPCTGLGCNVNYQLIYNLKTKKIFPFGRFRTGFDMDIYSFEKDKTHYLSKSFAGRNAGLRDTITFQIYQLDENQGHFLKPYYAKFIYKEESYDTPVEFVKNWIKD